jgi:hypothetical protein
LGRPADAQRLNPDAERRLMANLINEGFDWMPSGQISSVRTRLWAANNFFQIAGSLTADVETGRFDFGNALSLNGATTIGTHGYVVPTGANVASSFIGGGLIVFPSTEASCAPVIGVYDAVNDQRQLDVRFCANGVIKALRGDGTLLATSDAGAFQENEWFHFEMKPLIANSGGGVEVRINTVPKLQLVGADTQNTANAYGDSILIGHSNTSSNNNIHYALDDLFVNDTSGAQNNDWSGNLRVKTQFMIADATPQNFSIGGSSPAATHWQSVLNQLLDDSKFVYSPNVGDLEFFTPDPNLNSPLVRSLQVRMGLRQDDATQRVARAALKIGGTQYLGIVDQFTNQTFTFYKERWQLNPASGVSFTGADVNGLLPGLKVQA